MANYPKKGYLDREIFDSESIDKLSYEGQSNFHKDCISKSK